MLNEFKVLLLVKDTMILINIPFASLSPPHELFCSVLVNEKHKKEALGQLWRPSIVSIRHSWSFGRLFQRCNVPGKPWKRLRNNIRKNSHPWWIPRMEGLRLWKRVRINQEHGQELLGLQNKEVWTKRFPKCYMADEVYFYGKYFYQFYTRIQCINIFMSSIVKTFQEISVTQSHPLALAAYF